MAQTPSVDAPEIIVSATSVSDEAPTRSYFNMASTETVASPVAATAVPAPAAASVVPAPRAAAQPSAPQRNAAPAAPKGMPPVAAYTLSVDDMMGVAQAAGLQWVMSDAEKVSQAQAAIANTPKPVHVPREPKPVAVVDSGPLVLVETRPDLRDAKLPF